MATEVRDADFTAHAGAQSLAKRIRFHQLFAIGFGTMIGVGWIIVAGSWIVTAGPGGAILAFAVGAAAVLVLGLVYAEMGSTYPYSGGEIVYVFAGLGTAPTFFIGWLLTLTYVAVCAFETVAAPWIVAVLFPEVRGPTLYRILGSEVHLGDVVLGYLGLALLIGINVRGGFASARLQNIATGLKVLATLAFVVAALTHGSEANREPWFARDSSGSVVGATLAVLATVPVWYGGFNTLPQALGEVADLSRIRRLSIILATVILAGFIFFAAVILATASPIPRHALAESDFPVADALFAAFASPWPGRAVLIAGLMGITTSWNASLFCGARVLFSLSRARIIPAQFARVHPRFGSPAFSALFVGLIAAPVALLGRNSLLLLLKVVGLSYASGYLLVALSLYRLRRTDPLRHRPYRMPGHPYLTGLAVVIALAFVTVSLYNMAHSATGLIPPEFLGLGAWCLLGAAVWRSARALRSSVDESRRGSLIQER